MVVRQTVNQKERSTSDRITQKGCSENDTSAGVSVDLRTQVQETWAKLLSNTGKELGGIFQNQKACLVEYAF